ncbi:hypothetical protein BDR07DRAFT_1444678 [Suillus spraguei]|nr:hypothetical protein BDR07DRAFT_1444678 [Suillus spraguei]
MSLAGGSSRPRGMTRTCPQSHSQSSMATTKSRFVGRKVVLYHSQKPFWKPQLPKTSVECQSYSLSIPRNRPDHILKKNGKIRLSDEQCSNTIGEILKMAEGKHEIILGRLRHDGAHVIVI